MMWLIHAADVRVPTANAKEPQSGYALEAVEATPAASHRSRSQARALAAPSIIDAKVEELKRGTQPGPLDFEVYFIDGLSVFIDLQTCSRVTCPRNQRLKRLDNPWQIFWTGTH